MVLRDSYLQQISQKLTAGKDRPDYLLGAPHVIAGATEAKVRNSPLTEE